MIKTPQNIAILFDQQLAARSIPEQSRSHFCKWLRFYLDFCHKYGFTSSEKSSLSAFIDKLKEKKQNLYNQRQAAQAVSIYYDLLSTGNLRGKITIGKKKVLRHCIRS